jgi:hypothetical protein
VDSFTGAAVPAAGTAEPLQADRNLRGHKENLNAF